ncbi:capsid protein [Picobirnavirus 504]|nr:capsid protein [Picobirnavirus 504]
MMESSKKKSNQNKPSRPMRGKQGRKDNKSRRVNYDNMREDRVKKIIEEDSKTNSANDVSWYSRNPELLKSVASYPFANILGTPISNYDGSAIPGIVTFAYEPCFGGPSNPALTQCFNSMYSFVVHANSRNQSYDAPDLGILTMAGMQVFSIIGSVLRAYGVVKYYNERNRYLPDALLTAMGFKPADFRQNLSHIWFDINNFINQTKQIWVPDDLPVMDRWYWLNTNVFSDAEGDQAQMYVFVQNTYYIYSDIAVKTGSSLGPVASDGRLAPSSINGSFSPANTQYTWAVWKGVIQSMIDALIGSQDRGIIYGDILKAYTADRIRALQPIDSSFTLGPVYNAEALMQIENVATVDMSCSGFFQTSDGDMYTNWIVYPSGDNTKTSTSSEDNSAIISTNDNVLLNFHIPTQPTPEMIMIATRMTACQILRDTLYTISNWQAAGGATPSKTPTYYPFAVGSEIVNRIRLYQYVSALDGDPGIQIYNIPQYIQTNTSITSDGNNTLPGYLAQVLLLEAFDWHPFIYKVDHFHVSKDKTPIQGIQHIRYAYGDIDNYAVIDSLSLAAMHQVAIYSELGVPKM